MGIKFLNQFLKTECDSSIKLISISELSGKKIAIDISIYMYKYEAENNLIENMYLMLSIFRYYNIIPIFIFDGKPPTEKKELLQKRKADKLEAQKEYNNLKEQLQITQNIDESFKQEIICNMDILKKQFIYINKEKIDKVKNLIRAYGASYIDALGEADELCALLVIKQQVWACLSEDMDMFVYGCSRVIRYLSLLNHTVVLYNMEQILIDIGINQKELREICVLSGTDYNINSSHNIQIHTPTNLYQSLKIFKKYYVDTKNKEKIDFYKWLINNNYITDYDLLVKIYNMFDLSISNKNLNIFENIKIMNGPIIYNDIKTILETDGFIFPPNK
jgi:flap endonuclease-1